MKKHLLAILLLASFSFIYSSSVQGSHLEDTDTQSKLDYSTLILPNSPFYTLKIFKENFEFAVSFNNQSKFTILIGQSRSRLNEIHDSLLNLRLAEAKKLFQDYKKLLDRAANIYENSADRESFKILMTNEIDRNVNILTDLSLKFPERESVKQLYIAKDDTRGVIYRFVPGLVKIITPIALDSLKQYSFAFDIRPKLKYDQLRIPGSTHVLLYSGGVTPTIDEKFPFDDFLKKYLTVKRFLIIGNFTGDALDFANKIKEREMGQDKEIYVLENGFVNYAMNTDYPKEGRLAIPESGTAVPNEN